MKGTVQACDPCQRYKNPRDSKPAIKMLDTDGLPFSKICMDVSGPWNLTTRGNKFILVVMCMRTRYVEMFPLSSVTAIAVADILYEQIITRYGVPDTFLTDGTNFASNLIKCLCRRINIDKKVTTPFRPATNGRV